MPGAGNNDPISDAAARALAQLDVEGWRIGQDTASFWTHYHPPHGAQVAAGRKIHVSASVRSAPTVLARALPILVRARVPFKHAASAPNLADLSAGHGGSTQVGKFITAYPPDETACQLVAERLHEATAGLDGPRVPRESPFAKDSLVYSRFGAFSQGWVQLRTGRVVPAVRTDAGWVPDDRSTAQTDAPPSDAAGHGLDRGAGLPRRLGKYVALRQLVETPKGRTWLAADPEGRELVMVKERLAHTAEDLSGHDSVSRLRTEAENLARLQGLGISPTVLDVWDEKGSTFMAYEPVEGPTAGAVLADLAAQGMRPPVGLLVHWAESLADLLTRLHRAGLVAADVKPRNLVMMPDGFRLIDLELAGPPTAEPTGGSGTPGYCSPQQRDPSHGRSVSDDVFAFGATLLALATVQEASHLPPLSRVAEIEHGHDASNPVYPLIQACVDPDAAKRPATIAEALGHLRVADPVQPISATQNDIEIAAEIGERLMSSAEHPDPHHTCWSSDHPTAGGQRCRDVYVGSAGVALYLAELAQVTREERFLESAVECGHWLRECAAPVPRLAAMPGLYFGECGPSALYLRLGQLTGDRSWFAAAQDVAAGIDPAEVMSPDLMTGLAGVGLFHLMRWYATADPGAVVAAVECAEELGRRRATDRLTWPFPRDFDLLAGREYVGFSHGTAGVGYFIAELARVTQAQHWSDRCREAADWVLSQARQGLSDGSGLRWGAVGQDLSYGLNWCHGSPGVLRFLLAAHDTLGDDTYLDAARRAGRMVAWGGPWVGASQCHGLAGNIEALLDVEQRVRDGECLEHARRLAGNLLAYRTSRSWLSDRMMWSPDFMIGEAGVGAAFLRLARTERPHLLTPSAFAGCDAATQRAAAVGPRAEIGPRDRDSKAQAAPSAP
jgi:serine/threonine protein kinase